ncbi:uncharacterized protein si:dkeyp-51f12.3 [Sardina pilchardus]|uniref:uncharacterized protein si:dkeyp-51f12.3 n=1 Tax=Sardina pilchardus TaxID=27697 RepID=UPI002E165271
MPSPRAMAMTGGALLIAIGLSLFLTMHAPLQLVGFLLGVFGIIILVYAFCQAMKSDHVAVPGHFLLHPRTGTRYSPHQAMAIQRRLDRIRRAAEEEEHQVQPVSTPPALLQHLSQLSLPRTPPPWEMEPPPSYETVMKGSQSPVVQNS